VRAESSPVACPVFDLGGHIVRTISAVMRFDAMVEVTTSQLRVELMVPADDAAGAYLARAVCSVPDGAGDVATSHPKSWWFKPCS